MDLDKVEKIQEEILNSLGQFDGETSEDVMEALMIVLASSMINAVLNKNHEEVKGWVFFELGGLFDSMNETNEVEE